MRLSADTATEAFIVGRGWEQWEINLYITSLLCESGGYGHWMSPVRGREADKGKDIRVSSGSGWTLGPLFYQSSDTLMPWSKPLALATGVWMQMELYCNKLGVPGGHSSQDSTDLG